MGGLVSISFLLNNPNLNLTGVILSAPFLGMPKQANLDEGKKSVIKKIAPFLDVIFNHLLFRE